MEPLSKGLKVGIRKVTGRPIACTFLSYQRWHFSLSMMRFSSFALAFDVGISHAAMNRSHIFETILSFAQAPIFTESTDY